MKHSPALALVLLAFAFVMGIALLSRGSFTGHITAPAFQVSNSTVLSAIAAVLSIGVLFVAGLHKK